MPSRYTHIYMRIRQAKLIRTAGWGAVILLGMLVAVPPVRSAIIPIGGGPKGAMHKQVEQLEGQWRTAVLAGDATAMAGMLDESYVGIGPDGTIVNKAEELQARASGADRIVRFDVQDRKVRLYGTTAVVTSRVHLQGVYSGQPLLGVYRYTRVWTLTRGQWRIVSFEANRVHDVSARSK